MQRPQGTAPPILRFSETDSIASLLGHAATDLTYEIGKGGKHKYFRSPSAANFDAVSLYLLKCSVLSGHNYDASGSGGRQVSCAITPDVAPGNLIQYRPLTPLPCQAHALKGAQSHITDSIYNDRQQQHASGFERGVHRADID